ncbi:MAG: sulfotransferase domain-containing protein [Chloroflexota bacterium]
MIPQTAIGSRATTVEELNGIMSKFENHAAAKRGLAFKPKRSDVIISPYAKSGTTWTQHIVHGLRTRGSMDFDEITAVTPWIEIAYDVGWDLEAAQVAEPRVYKSHLSWHDVPKGARYIVPVRHYHDAFLSYYRFFEGWFIEPDSITLEAFLQWYWPPDKMDKRGYWHHLSSWWEQRHNPNVLLLSYEDMKADLPGTVEKIAHFIGIPLDDELLDIVVRQSSREFMLAHRHQFSARHVAQSGGPRAGLPPALDTYKITAGAPRDARFQLPPTLKATLDDMWREQITSKYGFESYAELQQRLKESHEYTEYRTERPFLPQPLL